MKKTINRLLYILLLSFIFVLTSCAVIDDNNNYEVFYEYENQQVLLDDFELSDIKIKVTDEDGNFNFIDVTEKMISDSDLEKIKTAGVHVIAIGYKAYIGEVVLILVEEYSSVYLENPYLNKKVNFDDFDISNIKIVISSASNVEYISVSLDMLSNEDANKIKNIGNHNISIIYLNYTFNTSINLVLNESYTYDKLGTKSKLKVEELNDVSIDGEYNNYLDVCSYIYHFHKLPSNYLTKSQAENLGWSGSGSNVWQNSNLYGKNIGGDTFYNKEGNLPSVTGYAYVEVDVNCSNGRRGSCRIVYNKYTWDIYYTSNHYDSFVYLIGVLK